MTPAEATAVDILKWVISPHRSVPAAEALDEDVLIDLASYHRIEARLLTRLESVRPAWCRPALRTRLRIQQHTIRRHAGERMAAAREITNAMETRGQRPPIFAKGFAAHALTNNPDGLHFSGDLDPFAENLPAFWEILHEIGYFGKRKDTHEWAKLRRGGITLDVHQHFPVLCYPPEIHALLGSALEARRNPGHWELPAPEFGLVSAAGPVQWEDVASGAVFGTAPGTEAILFPSPALLCLIHCAHCFRSSVTRLHYMDPRGGFRLYELLSIRELTRLPEFDADQFSTFVERFSAQDVVQLMNILAEAFLEEALLPKAGVSEAVTLFPEHLIFGGWVSLQETDDWLLARSIEQMFNQIGANSIPASSILEACALPRVLTYGEKPLLLPHLEITWDILAQSLVLKCMFREIPIGRTDYELLIHFGHDSFVKVRIDAAGAVGAVTQKSDYLNHAQPPVITASREDSSQTVQIACAVPNVPFRSQNTAPTLPLFFALRRLCPNGETTQAVTYLPFLLRP